MTVTLVSGERPSARSTAAPSKAWRRCQGVRRPEHRRIRERPQGEGRLRRRRPQQAEIFAARVEGHSSGLGKNGFLHVGCRFVRNSELVNGLLDDLKRLYNLCH